MPTTGPPSPPRVSMLVARSARSPIGWLTTAIVAAIVCDVAGIDAYLARWSQTAPQSQQGLAQAVTDLSKAEWWLVPLAVLAALGLWWQRADIARRATVCFAAIAVGGLAVHPFKWALGRARPKLLLEDDVFGYFWFQSGYAFASMPSGHSAVAGAGAVCLAMACPPLLPVFVGVTFLLALTRVMTASHYLGDVFVGYALGAAVAYGMHRALNSKPLRVRALV